MKETFYFCREDLVGRFSKEPCETCPLCLEPMGESGWASSPEEAPDSLSEALAD